MATEAGWAVRFTFAGVIASLMLCVVAWPDARAGVAVNVGLVLLLAIGARLNLAGAHTLSARAENLKRRTTMWPRSVRVTHLEQAPRASRRRFLILEPIGTLTHAITIRRPAREVWPWLAQMGAGTRAGWYSHDIIDNGRRRSAARIVEEVQHIAVGTLFPAVPGAIDGFHVLQFETWAKPRARVATCSERVASHDVGVRAGSRD